MKNSLIFAYIIGAKTAYNEQKTIVNLLKNVWDIPFFNEIIVINDGSQDTTGLLIKKLKGLVDIRDIHFQKNRGKGYAMAKGVELSNAEYLVFIDADLSNFTFGHANQLLSPLINGEADMVIGQPTETLINYDINPFKNLSGQRALKKKDIIPLLERMKPAGYGVETLINLNYKANQKVIKHVCLDQLIHPTKFGKTKPHIALKEFIIEGCQILATTLSNIDLTTKSAKNKVPNSLSINN